jgi:hypothetical protein
MSEILPTVRVVSADAPNGFVVINESDLTAEHKLHKDTLDEDVETDPAKFTAAQLRDALTAGGIAFPANGSKADLLALLTKPKAE